MLVQQSVKFRPCYESLFRVWDVMPLIVCILDMPFLNHEGKRCIFRPQRAQFICYDLHTDSLVLSSFISQLDRQLNSFTQTVVKTPLCWLYHTTMQGPLCMCTKAKGSECAKVNLARVIQYQHFSDDTSQSFTTRPLLQIIHCS